jgi:hypothetical protein
MREIERPLQKCRCEAESGPNHKGPAHPSGRFWARLTALRMAGAALGNIIPTIMIAHMAKTSAASTLTTSASFAAAHVHLLHLAARASEEIDPRDCDDADEAEQYLSGVAALRHIE